MEQEQQQPQEQEPVTPGQQWAQRLGVVGGIVVLLFSLTFVLTMLTAGPEMPDYAPAWDTAYYEQHPEDLQAELEQSVFPYVEGVQSCVQEDGKLVITISSRHYIPTRAVIINLFDRNLFVFEQN